MGGGGARGNAVAGTSAASTPSSAPSVSGSTPSSARASGICWASGAAWVWASSA